MRLQLDVSLGLILLVLETFQRLSRCYKQPELLERDSRSRIFFARMSRTDSRSAVTPPASLSRNASAVSSSTSFQLFRILRIRPNSLSAPQLACALVRVWKREASKKPRLEGSKVAGVLL